MLDEALNIQAFDIVDLLLQWGADPNVDGARQRGKRLRRANAPGFGARPCLP